MKGQVLYFDGIKGIISGEDSKRYKFNLNQWKEQIEPQKGYQVDFELLNDEVREIYLIEIPKNSFIKEDKISEVKNEISNKYKTEKFKLASIGSFLIALSIITVVFMLKSNVGWSIEKIGGRFVPVYDHSYFYIPDFMMGIGGFLFISALKYISNLVYKKFSIIFGSISISIIVLKLNNNPLIGIISVFIIFYSLYKLQETFKILSEETKNEEFKKIKKIFMVDFIIAIFMIICMILIGLDKLDKFDFFLIPMGWIIIILFVIGWFLNASIFYQMYKKEDSNTESIN
jgi:uncharacterized membrane protein YidH (DUF202 family)